MGTAVLLPRDCLPNCKSRQKAHLSVNFLSDRAPRLRKGTTRDSPIVCFDHSKKTPFAGRVEWTPKSTPLILHEHGPDPSQLRKEAAGITLKAKKPDEVKEGKSVCNTPVFTILQRPNTKEAANELILKFLVKVEGEQAVDDTPNRKMESCKSSTVTNCIDRRRPTPAGKSKLLFGNNTSSLKTKLPECNPKKGHCFIAPEERKILNSNLSLPMLAVNVKSSLPKVAETYCRNVTPCAVQAKNVPSRESERGLNDVMHLKGASEAGSLKGTSEQLSLKETGSIESIRSTKLPQSGQAIHESTAPSGLSRLKRSTTDPQIVKQSVGPCKSEVVDIPISKGKSCCGFARTASMSYPERWAGPSYYSSPAPSSLPLPNFSFPCQRMPSFRSSGREGFTRNITEFPELESSSSETALDVAFATKSLRKMLKLDPW